MELIIYFSMEKPWHERRYPEDFAGWLPLAALRGNRYLVLESPDKQYQCVIHLADNDVASVIKSGTGETVYTDPVSIAGARLLLRILEDERNMQVR